ncbi:MAG: AMP-binding protein, partial [Dehalococcoidia bacterium]|nr:AMP-binding protein [Dehalococcoidia bacterium]
MNTVDFLNIAAAICPDRPAIIFEGNKLTFSEITDRTNRLANSMAKLGIKKGDRVAILQVNCSQYVEAYFATAKLGGIFCPLNFRAKEDELTYMMNYAEVNLLFCGDRYVDMVKKIKPELKTVNRYVSLDNKTGDMLYYGDLLSDGSPEDVFTEIEDTDPTILMFTAGTTGRPKGVPQTHNSFTVYALENVEPVNLDMAEVNLLTVPLYHVAGIQAMMAAIYGGRTIAIMRQF